MHFTISLTALKHKKTCIKAVEVDPSYLQLVPDHFKMQEICDKAVKDDSSSLQFVPDWFIIREWTDMWHDDYYGDDGCHWGDDDGDKLLSGMMDIKNRRLKKPQLKKSYYPLLGIHQGGEIGACQKTKKRDRKIVDINMDHFWVWWPHTNHSWPKMTKSKDVFCLECF